MKYHKLASTVLATIFCLNSSLVKAEPNIAQVEALPLAGELCATGVGCIVVGAIVIGGTLFYILRDMKTGLEYKTPAGSPNHSVDEHKPSGNSFVKRPVNEYRRTRYFIEYVNYADTTRQCRQWFEHLKNSVNIPPGRWELQMEIQDDPDDPTGRTRDIACKARINLRDILYNDRQRVSPNNPTRRENR